MNDVNGEFADYFERLKTRLQVGKTEAADMLERLKQLDAQEAETADAGDAYLTGPGIGLGYFRLARPGDVAPEELQCRTCGQPLAGGDIWIAVISNGHGGCYLGGPLCRGCAVSE